MDRHSFRHSASLLVLAICWTPLGASQATAQSPGPVAVDTTPSLRIPVDPLQERPNLAVITADRRIVTTSSNGRLLIGYDALGKRRWTKGTTASGNGGFAFFFSLVHASRGTHLGIWDHLQSRLTMIDADGSAHGQRRLQGLPMVSDGGGGRSPHFVLLLGIARSGDIIARTSFDPGASATSGLHRDSAEVVRIDARGTPHVVRRTLMAEQYRRNSPYLLQGILPFGRIGAIAVGADSWYYTDGAAFRIERRALDGTLISTFGRPHSRRAVTELDIRNSRLASLAGVDSTLKPSMVSTLAWMPYPDSMPAYSDLHVDSEGLLWAAVYAPPWEDGRWDIFDQDGRQLGEVTLPRGLRVLDIAKDALLAYHAEPGGIAELRIHRLTRTGP